MVAPSLEVESHLFPLILRNLLQSSDHPVSARLAIALAQRRHYDGRIVLGVREDPFPRLPLQLRIERLYGIGGVHGLTDLLREIIVCEYVVVRRIQHPGHATVL